MSQIDDFLNGTPAPQAPAGHPSQVDAFLNPPPRKRTLASIANDTVIEVANAAAGGVSSAANFVRPGKSAIVQHDRALLARRSALVEQFAMAAMAGDEEGKADARQDIAKFNEKNPNRRIQPMQLAQSVNMRQKRIREAQEGVYLPGKRQDALEAGRFAIEGRGIAP